MLLCSPYKASFHTVDNNVAFASHDFCAHMEICTNKVLLNSFQLNGHTPGFIHTLKVIATLYIIINRTTGKYCSVHVAFI